ncbi:MAG: DUF4239 domain-containing protein [Alphaproteobacteria bacterium]|nr:DUF4239 domain-containing protein [Alphaproteobacteria bacterium]
MISVAIFFISFACLLAGAWIGMTVRRILPEHHLSPASTDVIKLATNLLATLVALVLSLLVSSANAFYGMIENEYRGALANIVRFDQYLQAYGPETHDLRRQVRQAILGSFREHWPHDDFGPEDAAVVASVNPVIDLQKRILDLDATTPSQKWFQAQALQRLNEAARIRQLTSGVESTRSMPVPIVIALLAAATAIFVSFSLLVKPNPTVITALATVAVAVSGALFLIVELNTPFSGVMQLSSEPAHAVLTALGK